MDVLAAVLMAVTMALEVVDVESWVPSELARLSPLGIR